MSHNTSRVGQRADKIVAVDEHEDYHEYDPWTGDLIATYDEDDNVISGMPILTETPIGEIVDKSVLSFTLTCPDCGIPAYYDEKNEPVCEQCGMICSGNSGENIGQEQIVADPRAAERMPPGNQAEA